MKKETRQKSYLDYMCKIGERVYWLNMRGERFEGTLVEWGPDHLAYVKFDDDTIVEYQC